jgi:hypothetical protein
VFIFLVALCLSLGRSFGAQATAVTSSVQVEVARQVAMCQRASSPAGVDLDDLVSTVTQLSLVHAKEVVDQEGATGCLCIAAAKIVKGMKNEACRFFITKNEDEEVEVVFLDGNVALGHTGAREEGTLAVLDGALGAAGRGRVETLPVAVGGDAGDALTEAGGAGLGEPDGLLDAARRARGAAEAARGALVDAVLEGTPVGLERTEVLGVIASALHVAFTNGQIFVLNQKLSKLMIDPRILIIF